MEDKQLHLSPYISLYIYIPIHLCYQKFSWECTFVVLLTCESNKCVRINVNNYPVFRKLFEAQQIALAHDGDPEKFVGVFDPGVRIV